MGANVEIPKRPLLLIYQARLGISIYVLMPTYATRQQQDHTFRYRIGIIGPRTCSLSIPIYYSRITNVKNASQTCARPPGEMASRLTTSM